MTDPRDIPPALDDDYWSSKSYYCSHASMHLDAQGNAEISATSDSGWPITSEDRHAFAALCLYEQPFGFDAEDVAWLKRMQFFTLDKDEAEQHQEWWQSFLARVSALLPPSP